MIDWSISRYEVPLILVNKHLREKLPQSIHVNSSLTLLAMFQQGGCSCERVCQSGMLCLCSKRSERQRLWYEVCHQPLTNSHSLFDPERILKSLPVICRSASLPSPSPSLRKKVFSRFVKLSEDKYPVSIPC